jgi:DNA-directed RNA polymerase sigma subunit (sigma70/sigma32)
MVEDKEMSKKIEILEDELAEKENTIIKLRRKKTMTLEEIKEELVLKLLLFLFLWVNHLHESVC